MNLGRNAAGGRNWEGAGPDPFLQAVHAVTTIKGIQDQGVIACAKHFALNEQEHYRGGGSGIASSSNIDDRTFHEVYLWPFAASVKAGVASGTNLCLFIALYFLSVASDVFLQPSKSDIRMREPAAS